MEQFASGWKRNYYGKGDVTVYRLNRDGKTPAGQSPVFAANVLMLIYGDAFWPTYTKGDNTGLVATDSMKNFIQRETMNFEGAGLEELCQFLGNKFLGLYPQVEGAQVSAEEIPYRPAAPQASFAPAGPDRAYTRLEINRRGTVEAVSGLRGFKLLRLGGSAFHGFVRDEYTTLPEIRNRPLNMWLDMEWSYAAPDNAFTNGSTTAAVRQIVFDVFASFESGSIQEVIYQMGTKMLAEHVTIAEIHLEANNRTWDTVAERGDELGVFTDARPPYGCLGQAAPLAMARLSTHVLDTARGVPAQGVTIELYSMEPERLLQTATTNADGRTSEPLLSEDRIKAGVYQLRFRAGEYFRASGIVLPDPPFLNIVVIQFAIAQPEANYHIPLLISPYAYSTYRGS